MTLNVGSADDHKLVERIAAGDKAAVQVLFSRHHTRVYRFIERQVGDPSLAEDLANEVFLDVWRQANRFEGRSSVSTWLMAIGRNKAISALRRRRELPLDENYARTIEDGADSSEVTLQKIDKANALRTAIDTLSPDHKAVIDLIYYQEMQLREVAHVLDIPLNTVKTRIFHARKKLADVLAKSGVDRGWP